MNTYINGNFIFLKIFILNVYYAFSIFTENHKNYKYLHDSISRCIEKYQNPAKKKKKKEFCDSITYSFNFDTN